MKTFRISFLGRKAGAIGVFHRIALPLINAEDSNDAKRAAMEVIYADDSSGYEMFSQELWIEEVSA